MQGHRDRLQGHLAGNNAEPAMESLMLDGCASIEGWVLCGGSFARGHYEF
jgi:hypothetical protein